MIIMEFDINKDLIDSITTNNTPFLESIFHHAESVIDSGGQVKIMQKYDNSSPEVKEVISSKQELGKWKTEVNQILIKMK